MRRPQIVVFERDGRLARQLDGLASDKKWTLRESRQVEPCLRLLAGQGPSVLVVRLSANSAAEVTLLSGCGGILPHVATVAVSDANDDPGLAGLAWDLDADFVLCPPVPTARLPAIVEGLMRQA